MGVLDIEISAFERMQDELETKHMNRRVLIKGADLVSAFDSFEDAAKEAIRRFGRGPYLIRRVGPQDLVVQATICRQATHVDR